MAFRIYCVAGSTIRVHWHQYPPDAWIEPVHIAEEVVADTVSECAILRLDLSSVRFHSETIAPLRRGGRAVECACLENKYVGNGIAGSNPVPSASAGAGGGFGVWLRASYHDLVQRRNCVRAERAEAALGLVWPSIPSIKEGKIEQLVADNYHWPGRLSTTRPIQLVSRPNTSTFWQLVVTERRRVNIFIPMNLHRMRH